MPLILSFLIAFLFIMALLLVPAIILKNKINARLKIAHEEELEEIRREAQRRKEEIEYEKLQDERRAKARKEREEKEKKEIEAKTRKLLENAMTVFAVWDEATQKRIKDKTNGNDEAFIKEVRKEFTVRNMEQSAKDKKEQEEAKKAKKKVEVDKVRQTMKEHGITLLDKWAQ